MKPTELNINQYAATQRAYCYDSEGTLVVAAYVRNLDHACKLAQAWNRKPQNRKIITVTDNPVAKFVKSFVIIH